MVINGPVIVSNQEASICEVLEEIDGRLIVRVALLIIVGAASLAREVEAGTVVAIGVDGAIIFIPCIVAVCCVPSRLSLICIVEVGGKIGK